MRRLLLFPVMLGLMAAALYFPVRSQEQIEVGYAVLEVEGSPPPQPSSPLRAGPTQAAAEQLADDHLKKNKPVLQKG